ncbi:hypothetical protein MCAP1_003175 [Malassezia caprae]|uniref:Uncharacterized protein n=1 Tax=Malassezia caprae TaxID=1381934 RepID=A0AAF0J1D8_9BASI|nr:hypothetical protein MCAP1_003175 [Malassezia caprae]
MKLRELRLTSTLHGWDPLRILAQITALQAIHYILLAAFVPPLLSIFTEPAALRFEGGPAQVGMIIDWRELASQPTWDWDTLTQLVNMYTGWTVKGQDAPEWTDAEQAAVRNWTAGAVWLNVAYINGSAVPQVLPPPTFRWNDTQNDARNETGAVPATPEPSNTLLQQEAQLEQWEWHKTHDVRRGWAISFAWLLTILFDVQVLYYLVRKPTHVLDFVCTMHLVHFLLTSWYAGSIPYSLYWWLVMVLHATLCIVCAERLAIQREMLARITWH